MTIDEAIKKQILRCIVGGCDESCKHFNERGCDCNSMGQEAEEWLNKAIEALKYQQEHQAKVQKCIERISTQIIVDCEKYELDDELSACVEDSHNRDLEIIKEEMGVE